MIANDRMKCYGRLLVLNFVLLVPRWSLAARQNVRRAGMTTLMRDVGHDNANRELQTNLVVVGAVYKGNNNMPDSAYPLGLCEADCDNDGDCQGDLVCLQRDDDEPVEGCTDLVIHEGQDFCYNANGSAPSPPTPPTPPTSPTLPTSNQQTDSVQAVYKGNNNMPDSAFPLGLCEGDCDNDEDCQGDLVCLQRDDDEPVAGCTDLGIHEGQDFCYNANGSTPSPPIGSSSPPPQPKPTTPPTSLTPPTSNQQTDSVQAVYKGNNNMPDSAFPLGLCEGDCDNDGDCQGDLVCLQRDDDEPVAGCTDLGIHEGQDFCYNANGSPSPPTSPTPPTHPTPPSTSKELNWVGDNGSPSNVFPLKECLGDCDSDSDCAGSLVCYERDSGDSSSVPGCAGEGSGRIDYCIDPSRVSPVASPVSVPSSSDSSPVSMPPPTRDPISSESTSESSSSSSSDSSRDDFPSNDVPRNPPDSYFNYDTRSRYGPDRWDDVDTSESYFKEFSDEGFGIWEDHLGSSAIKNRCDRDGKQSPINLEPTEDGCEEIHMIRTRAGKFGLGDSEIEKSIEHNKLRLIMNRRPCRDLEDRECSDMRPPMTDFPRYTPGNSDLLNLDIKVPSEHWLEGEVFDAELQMMHTHLVSGRVASIGVLVRATSRDSNDDFQDILDEFQEVYDSDMDECEGRRRLTTSNTTKATQDARSRRIQRSLFDPYNRNIMRTIYFYRYDGSTTEPPCYFITWYILTEPMLISFDQLEQLKTLLFTHVDGDCEKTSTHYKESVARPLQPVRDRTVTKCTKDDFVSDEDKKRGMFF